MSSETSHARPTLRHYCTGLGLDIGFGGDPIVPDALTMDLPQPYTRVGPARQLLRGDARDLGFLCDESLDYVYSSHLLEDFTWSELPAIVCEWRRVLRPGGYWVTVCPDEPAYRADCQAHGIPPNTHHRNHDFTLITFLDRVVDLTGPWEIPHLVPLIRGYSWHLVCRKPHLP